MALTCPRGIGGRLGVERGRWRPEAGALVADPTWEPPEEPVRLSAGERLAILLEELEAELGAEFASRLRARWGT